MLTLSLLLLVVGLLCFIFAALGTSSRIELKAAGLACVTAALIAGRFSF